MAIAQAPSWRGAGRAHAAPAGSDTPAATLHERELSLRDLANIALYDCQDTAAWRGWPMDKCAQDVLLYQEMIAHLRPDVVIETGTWRGGSALFLADLCALNRHGTVLSVDIALPANLPRAPRLRFIEGDSTAYTTLAHVRARVGRKRGLVILDSDHSQVHVEAELDAYSEFVAVGNYLVVEDTNINGHPVGHDWGAGPYEAVEAWLPQHPEFVRDTEVEPYLTFAPGGFLRRVK